MFLNDTWHQVMNNPELWVESLQEATFGLEQDTGKAAFGTQVMPTHHIDDARLYFTNGGLIYEISAYSRMFDLVEARPHILDVMRKDVTLVQDILDTYQYRLSRISPA